MNICFLARPCYDKFSSKIYLELKRHYDSNIGGCFIVNNEIEENYIKKIVPEAKVFNVSQFIKEKWNSFSCQDLKQIEEKYDCKPIWKYIYTDRFLIFRNHEYCVKTTVGLFLFFESVFKNNKIDYYYSETIATLQCYIAYLVGKKHGVKYIAQMVARGLDSTHHYFVMDEFQYNVNFNNNYLDIQYSDEEIKKADEFLKEFESRDITPANMVFTGKKPKFHLYFLSLPFRRIGLSKSKKYSDPYSYIYYLQHKKITDPLIFYLKYHLSKKYYQKANINEKYVYFPLHYQPEASTIVCAQKYEKQLFFIDSWAKSLPADTKLYVKEHYAILGHRDISFYKELKKYPNVVLINPWENSRKLIENAVAITTLTGTAGWEAMLLRKPVFIGGNIFFDNAPGVIKISDMYLNYLPLLESWEKPERQLILKYLCEYFRTLYKGNVYAANPASLNQENIEHVAHALYEQMMIHMNET